MKIPYIFSWQNFRDITAEGVKIFLFYLAVLCVFRLLFIALLHDYMAADTGAGDILAAFVRGARLSLTTAGAITAIVFAPVFVAHYVCPAAKRYLFVALNAAAIFVTSILFVAAFPYYRQFHANFDRMVFVGLRDDYYAIFVTLVQELYLPLGLAAAIFLSVGLFFALKKFLRLPLPLAAKNFSLPLKILLRAAYLALLWLMWTLSCYGGGLGWETAADWENSGVTKDSFLNEAILDGFQALYRANELEKRFAAGTGLFYSAEDVKLLAASLAKKAPVSDDLAYYLAKNAGGAKIPKPEHIFVILSESYANWPLLPQYEKLGIADGMKKIIAADDSDYCPVFLPNGASTISAVTGVATNLADANVYLADGAGGAFPTASAPQMKQLGYAANFWYAGPASWENIGSFTRAQGFDFFSRGDFPAHDGSVWGMDDEYLYDEILVRLKADEPSFNVILNASNHSPYEVDLAAAGFAAEKVRAALPPDVRGDERLLKELGHFWYADRELSRFVAAAKKKFPASLFVIVGDHANRYHIAKTPSAYEQFCIPFVVTGAGIYKGILSPESAGSQIDIMPTVFELVAPKDFAYLAVGESLTTNTRGVNYALWVTRDAIGDANIVPLEPRGIYGGEAAADVAAMQDYINAVRAVSFWIAKNGMSLSDDK